MEHAHCDGISLLRAPSSPLSSSNIAGSGVAMDDVDLADDGTISVNGISFCVSKNNKWTYS